MTTLLGLIAAVPLFTNSPSSVAIIETVAGNVRVQRAGNKVVKTIAARPLMLLDPGDRIEVPPEGQLTLVPYRDGVTEELGPGKYKVEKDGIRGNSKVENVKKLHAPADLQNGKLKEGWNSLKRGSGRGAGLVLRGAPLRTAESVPAVPQVTPIVGEVLITDRPPFTWPAAENAKSYQVRLSMAGSNRSVWSADAAGTALDYPADEPPLKRNRKYVWQVLAAPESGPAVPHVTGTFTIDQEWQPDDRKHLELLAASDVPFKVLLAISTYQAFDLEQAALAGCERLVKLVSDDADVWRLLSDNLDRAGRHDEAEKAYENAKELGFVPEELEEADAADAPAEKR